MAQGPTNTLNVANLPFGTSAEAVKSLCGPAVVECSLLAPGADGSIVALVLFTSPVEAAAAIDRLNGQVPEGLAQGMQQPLAVKFSPTLVLPSVPQVAPSPYGAAPGAPYAARSCPYGAAPPAPAAEVRTSSDNLYIKGLPQGTTYESLLELFSKYGTVTRCKTIDARTPFQSCHGLVQYSTPEEAATVKATLDGVTLTGAIEPLSLGFVVSKGKGFGKGWEGSSVNGASAGQSWEGGGGASGGKGWGKQSYGHIETKALVRSISAIEGILPQPIAPDGTEVYVSGLPFDCREEDVYRMFTPFGAVAPYGVSLLKHPDGSCRGFAFVNFIDPASANAAVGALNGANMPEGGYLKVAHKIPNYRQHMKGAGKDSWRSAGPGAGGNAMGDYGMQAITQDFNPGMI